MEFYARKLSELEIKYAIQDWLLKEKGLSVINSPGTMRNPMIKLGHGLLPGESSEGIEYFAECELALT